jgi:hypothetical protein
MAYNQTMCIPQLIISAASQLNNTAAHATDRPQPTAATHMKTTAIILTTEPLAAQSSQ